MEADVQIDASSASPSDPTDILSTLSQPDLAKWRETGEIPTPSSTPADSTPAEPVEQAASTDALLGAASEPAKPTKKTKGADSRVEELLADRAEARARADRLERQLAELSRSKTDDKPAASSAATGADADPEPSPETYDTYEKYVKAQARWEARQEVKAVQAEGARESQRQTVLSSHATRMDAYGAKLAKLLTADPALAKRIETAEIGQLVPISHLVLVAAREGKPRPPLTPDNWIAQEIVESDVSRELTVHLAEHPEDLATLRAAPNPEALKKLVGRLEGRLMSSASADSPPLTRTITNAPAPPTTLGSRPAASADAVVSAFKSGDERDYIRAMNARDAAARKR